MISIILDILMSLFIVVTPITLLVLLIVRTKKPVKPMVKSDIEELAEFEAIIDGMTLDELNKASK